MIISKPKLSSLFSLGIFLVLIYGLLIYQLIHFHGALYQYILLAVLIPIAVGVTLKILLSFKTIRIAKGSFQVHYPFRFTKYSRELKELKAWKQHSIQTKNGLYKEVKVVFEDNKQFSLSLQEYENFDKVLKYLRLKVGKKEVRE